MLHLHEADIESILQGHFTVKRNGEFSSPPWGFDLDDKVWIRPLEDHELEVSGERRLVQLSMDSGGDVNFSFHHDAGMRKEPRRSDMLPVVSLSSEPKRFTERGVTKIQIIGLAAIEAYKRNLGRRTARKIL
jgi:hypothetical protein